MSDIAFFFEDITSFETNQDFIKNQLQQLIIEEEKEPGDISVIFCSDEYLLEMNKKHLQHDYYTDIITFNYVDDLLISGDLFISADRIKDNAVKFGVAFLEELYRVIFHGVLHLIGYNDKTEAEQKVMRQKENYYLAKVDFRRLEE
ncbi:rRNA maturation RNase YbeY [Tangfeifania diversioriginum]|uniref:Endoribonuclease YbeY n=1 Tax=Tangfeifania diversioriginum TaxID=1168035 RepID=A0A1M6FBK3_9BACT|nr:rRNA maturation RNase YbeY [Tangfeifania diversioriginum]SHI95090.1 rRNA maturation RNase YbeY [Tangfeifania diversioriginum]